MKRLILLFIFLFIIQANVFSLARFAVKEPVLYVDFNIKNIHDVSVDVWKKLVGKERFEIQYILLKNFLISSFDGIDITDESFLRSVGIANKSAGFIINSVSDKSTLNKDISFIIAIPINDPKLARQFFIKLLTRDVEDERIIVNKLYKGNMINIIKSTGEYGVSSGEYSISVVGGYLLISRLSNSIETAVDSFNSMDNFTSSNAYKESLNYIKEKDRLGLIIITKKTFEFFKHFLPNNNEFLRFSALYKGLYNFTGIWFVVDGSEIAIESITKLDSNSSVYPSMIKTYKPNIQGNSLFNYLPDNPYLITNLFFDFQEYFNKVMPKIPYIKNKFEKDWKSILDNLTKELGFDVRTNIINNFDNQYSFLIYDYSVNNGELDFLNGLDFLAYAKVKDEVILEGVIHSLVNKLRELKKRNNTDMIIAINIINGIEFYNINSDEFNVYFGIFEKHFILATKKKRIKSLINNFNMKKTPLKDSLRSNRLLNEINKNSSYSFVDLKRIYNDRKFPLEWMENIKLDRLKSFRVYNKLDNDIIFYSLKVSFN